MLRLLIITKNLNLYDNLLRENSVDTLLERTDSIETALAHLESRSECRHLIIDIEALDIQEIDYVHYIHNKYPHVNIIILTDIAHITQATRAIQSGALFYLILPVSSKTIEQALQHLNEARREYSKTLEDEHQLLYDLIGDSPRMERVIRLVTKVAPSSATVLLTGENGTGKEFIATILHNRSRQLGEFVPVNCGAIPDNLFESELFGHKKGSFTGADKDRPGLVKEAEGGTLFLDEVGELSLSNQVKLLRFLQEKKFKPVGANTEIRANLRIISASNRDLRKMVAENTFREDLFYRLHVFPIHIPPLRERKDTLPNLIRTFVITAGKKNHTFIRGFSKNAEIILKEHDYPGNIRELENIIEHATIMSETSIITEQDLPLYLLEKQGRYIDMHSTSGLLPYVAPHNGNTSDFTDEIQRSTDTPQKQSNTKGEQIPEPIFETGPHILPLEELEHKYIEFALTQCNNNYSETAKKLNVSRSTLWRKMKERK
jgi:DNA-binding NtrC family response regulator